MNQTLANILESYKQKQKTGLIETDRQELEEGRKILQERLRESKELEAKTVRLGEELYFYLADRQGIVDLYNRYLTQPLSVDEKARAWWVLIDNLCQLLHGDEFLNTHQLYLDWVQMQWKKSHLSSSRLLLAIADESWAQSWFNLGKIDAWFQNFHTILALVEPTPTDRLERFFCLRTACAMCRACGKDDEALASITKIRALAQEDSDWERSWEMEIQAIDMEARIYLQRQENDSVRRIGKQAQLLLEARIAAQSSDEQKMRLAIQYDNVAATMFMADVYDLSIPLHRRCLELTPAGSEFVYLALPAALWATTKERQVVLDLLREGAIRCRGDWFATDFQEMPEFADVREDSEFNAAVTIR